MRSSSPVSRPTISRSRVILGAVAGLAVVAVLSIVVGFVGPGPETTHVDVLPDGSISVDRSPEGGFNWELAALFGTALGTTLLALATGALAFSTWQDVPPSQRLATAATHQLEVAREANELTRSEQSERLRPAVIAAVEAGSSFEKPPTVGSGHLAVELHNVGGGPAVRLEVGAIYTRPGPEAFVVKVQGRTIPTLAPGGTFPIALSIRAAAWVGSVDFSAFRVVGRYFDRLGNPAGEIVDWKHTTVEPPTAEATATAPAPSVVITEDEDPGGARGAHDDAP